MLHLAAQIHNRAAVCLHAAHTAALRWFCTDWLPAETPFLPQNPGIDAHAARTQERTGALRNTADGSALARAPASARERLALGSPRSSVRAGSAQVLPLPPPPTPAYTCSSKCTNKFTRVQTSVRVLEGDW